MQVDERQSLARVNVGDGLVLSTTTFVKLFLDLNSDLPEIDEEVANPVDQLLTNLKDLEFCL